MLDRYFVFTLSMLRMLLYIMAFVPLFEGHAQVTARDSQLRGKWLLEKVIAGFSEYYEYDEEKQKGNVFIKLNGEGSEAYQMAMKMIATEGVEKSIIFFKDSTLETDIFDHQLKTYNYILKEEETDSSIIIDGIGFIPWQEIGIWFEIHTLVIMILYEDGSEIEYRFERE